MIIADTGFWLALANQKDRHHKHATILLEGLNHSLVTTWPVMTETCYLLRRRLGWNALKSFMTSYQKGAFEVFDLDISHNDRLLILMEKYRDLPMDLADASLVVLAEALGQGLILSTDRRDFKTYRWKNRKPFKNLLLVDED